MSKNDIKHSLPNERLSALIEVLPDAFFFKDGAGRWQIINKSAKRLFHLEGIPWEGKTDMELAELHPDFREIHAACIADDEKAWQAKQLVVIEERMAREDGQQAIYETRKLSLFKENGERAGIIIIGRDITAQKEAEEQVKHMAFYDDLTGLPNRRFLDIQMEQAMTRADRHDRLLAVCMLDLDGFKPVNDTYGHKAGDEVLIALGERLPETSRKSDFVARLGGDEFVLLVEDLENLNDLANILTKMGDTISAPISLSNGESVQIGASMGVAIYPFGDTDTGDKLLRLADQALYESKVNKASRERFWTFFGETPIAKPTPAQQLLEAGALEVWYQPILDNFTRKIVGLEALARLRDNEENLWIPARFLCELQDADLTTLTQKVLAQALVDLAVLDRQGHALWISVNLDVHSVSAECAECLGAIIASNDINPARITLEILEGNDFLEQDQSIELLFEMKKLGIHLALDDLGSAYGSLLRLKTLPFDKIKLDQAFVCTLEKHPRDLYFVNTVQDLSTDLGVTLVVEGVETEDILDAVTVTGVSLLQGSAIACPLPMKELQKFLQHSAIERSRYPNTYLGLYALHLAIHSILEKTMRQNLRLMDYKEMVDPTVCPLHRAMQHLGASEGSPLYQYHQDYHKAIAELVMRLSASPGTGDWCMVEQARNTLEEAILDIYESKNLQTVKEL